MNFLSPLPLHLGSSYPYPFCPLPQFCFSTPASFSSFWIDARLWARRVLSKRAREASGRDCSWEAAEEGIQTFDTFQFHEFLVIVLRSMAVSFCYSNLFCVQPRRRKGTGGKKKQKPFPATYKILQMLADDYKDGKAGQETVAGVFAELTVQGRCSGGLNYGERGCRPFLALLSRAGSSFKPAGKSQSALFALGRHFILFLVLEKDTHLSMHVGAFFMNCYSEIPNKEWW